MKPAEYAVKYADSRRVVCAANLLKDGTLILGARHWDSVMHKTFRQIYGDTIRAASLEGKQGFIDQWGNFMSREEARIVAERQGQLLARADHGLELFSEDIY